MRTLTTQNLNEYPNGTRKGSIWSHGRAWWRRYRGEWAFGRKARDFAVTMNFGGGDDNRGVGFHVCIPFLFSVFLTACGIWPRLKKEVHTGIAIHNQACWLYILPYANESNRTDPWWRKTYSWSFPWSYDWFSTEVLPQKALNVLQFEEPIHIERKGRKRRCIMDRMREEEKAVSLVSETHDYTYTLKNGTVQHRKATIHVMRRTWRMKWWPLLPFKKASTTIEVKFSEEVGEGTGSYKGGCVGSGYEMQGCETPLETLRRMERERKFDR